MGVGRNSIALSKVFASFTKIFGAAIGAHKCKPTAGSSITPMPAQTDIPAGVAGSITMIVLTIAVALLLTSFYRRYKRAAKSEDETTQN